MGMRQKAICIKPGFFILAAAAILFLGIRPTALIFAAAGMHELGHLAAILACGGTVKRMQIGALGAEIVFDGYFPYGKDALITLAGPVFSFIAAATSGCLASYTGSGSAYYFAGLNLIYGVFNLMPISPMDGGRILYAIMAWAFGPFAAQKIEVVFDCVFSIAMFLAGIYVFAETGRNPTLMLCAILLITRCCKRRKSSVEFSRK